MKCYKCEREIEDLTEVVSGDMVCQDCLDERFVLQKDKVVTE